MPFVLDASVTLAWSFRDEQSVYSHRVLRRLDDDSALVPPVWLLEVTNGMLIAERRGRVSEEDRATILGDLAALPIESSYLTVEQALGPVLDLARVHKISAYDASYLELAMREGLSLATQDDDMRAAAVRAGVPLVE